MHYVVVIRILDIQLLKNFNTKGHDLQMENQIPSTEVRELPVAQINKRTVVLIAIESSKLSSQQVSSQMKMRLTNTDTDTNSLQMHLLFVVVGKQRNQCTLKSAKRQVHGNTKRWKENPKENHPTSSLTTNQQKKISKQNKRQKKALVCVIK